VFGNYFGGTTDSQGGYWPDAQSKAINIKLEQNSAGPTTCDLMEDLTFYKNFGKNMHSGVDVVGRTVGAQSCTNKPDRVLIRDTCLSTTPLPGLRKSVHHQVGPCLKFSTVYFRQHLHFGASTDVHTTTQHFAHLY